MFRTSEKRICAFCKLSHRIYLKKDVSTFDMLLNLGVTGLLALAIWGGPDLRSMLIFMALSFAMQVFLRVRYRESLKCPHCGFDPILYKANSEMAAQRVKDFLNKRTDNPAFMLKPKPQIKPIIRKKDSVPTDLTKVEAESLAEGEEAQPLQPSKPVFLDRTL